MLIGYFRNRSDFFCYFNWESLFLRVVLGSLTWHQILITTAVSSCLQHSRNSESCVAWVKPSFIICYHMLTNILFITPCTVDLSAWSFSWSHYTLRFKCFLQWSHYTLRFKSFQMQIVHKPHDAAIHWSGTKPIIRNLFSIT